MNVVKSFAIRLSPGMCVSRWFGSMSANTTAHTPLINALVRRELSSVTSCLMKSTFLKPRIPSLIISCGLKIKGKPRKRCKDCYFVVRQERLYVMCKTHQRHKQASLKAPEKVSWILSHATQSPVRPW
ncbi:hypothetical protein R5R35_013018 [Gryllus longicercus]|uniref:Large ribosomal subunit protein bL36m n=1 Tax=Gryllus longicercus TaxID=2509291 RepID=A0AAN9VB25_9ORTH